MMPAWLLNKYVLGGIGVFLLILLAWWQIDAYGDRRQARGVEITKAAYKAASDRLIADAARSATRSDDDAALRVRQHSEETAREVERINEAEASGGSPLDILFGNST